MVYNGCNCSKWLSLLKRLLFVSEPLEFLNNLKIADIKSIGAMKMEVMLRRSNFRDYYDIYSILKSRTIIHDLSH